MTLKNKIRNPEKYHNVHILIKNEVNNKFKKVIKDFNSYGLGNTNKSQLIRFFIELFIYKYANFTEHEKIDLFLTLKKYKESDNINTLFNSESMININNKSGEGL